MDKPLHPEDDKPMEFIEHLQELRVRLVRVIIGVLPGFAVCWYFRQEILDLYVRPLVMHWKELNLGEPAIHFANPVDPFVAYIKIALVSGVVLSSPWIFWQIWGFISPGLYRNEKKVAIPFVLASTLCFAGGGVFGYLVVFPGVFDTLLGFAGQLPSGQIKLLPKIMINEYLSFATRLLLAFGLVFEVPVVITALSFTGVVTARQLWAFGRWWILISTIVAAILTPPDVGSQLIMLGPLVVLYFLSIGIALLIEKSKGIRA